MDLACYHAASNMTAATQEKRLYTIELDECPRRCSNLTTY